MQKPMTKFDHGVKVFKFQPGSKFEHSWQYLRTQCYKPSFKVIGLFGTEDDDILRSLPYIGIAAMLVM